MTVIKVAIIEDHKATRQAFERIINLSPDCHCVCACSSAEEGLQIVPKHQPDVVLMDIQLPKMSGVDCAGKMKELLPSAQIIMVTVYEDPDIIFSALRAGACGYLLKRATSEHILGAIREVQSGGVPMSVGVARKVVAYFHGQSAATKEIDDLSTREREVLDLLAQGFSNKAIAARLGVSLEGILWHLKHIYQKLHVHSRTQAVLKLRPRT
jgi:DNA-binding NarL/FixJ family response regulator